MRAISLDQALTIMTGTFAAAAERKLRPLAAVVLDAGGHPFGGCGMTPSLMLNARMSSGSLKS